MESRTEIVEDKGQMADLVWGDLRAYLRKNQPGAEPMFAGLNLTIVEWPVAAAEALDAALDFGAA